MVRAQSLEESMEQALLTLHLTHKDAQKIEAAETNESWYAGWSIETAAFLAATNLHLTRGLKVVKASKA